MELRQSPEWGKYLGSLGWQTEIIDGCALRIKKLGSKVFDLWGASNNLNDEKDPWYGFTRFKMSFGATHITLAPTHDLIINNPLYTLFAATNRLRWKLLKLII